MSKRLRKFGVRIDSHTLAIVLRIASRAHNSDPQHDVERCKACDALCRIEEELEIGQAEATPWNDGL